MLDQITRLIENHEKLLIATLTAIIAVGSIGGGLWINVSLARIEAQSSIYEQQLKLEQKKFEQLWLTTMLRSEQISQHLDSIEITLNSANAIIPSLIEESILSATTIKEDIQKLNSVMQKMQLQLSEAKKEDEQFKKQERILGTAGAAAVGGLGVASLLIGAGMLILITLVIATILKKRKNLK